jgi:hypothetical protein
MFLQAHGTFDFGGAVPFKRVAASAMPVVNYRYQRITTGT